MITYLILSISVCTFFLVVFISVDALRNRGVADKTREDIEMIKKSVREMKSPVAYTTDNYVIIPKSHLDEYNKSVVEVPYKKKGYSSPVTAGISRTYHPSRTLRWGMIL